MEPTLATSYVKTSEQVAQIQALLASRRYATERIQVDFETTFEFVRAVLPPCFDVPAEPVGRVKIGNTRSGTGIGDYTTCIIDIDAVFEGALGSYFIMMLVSGFMPVAVGREFMAEPKKPGSGELHRNASEVYGKGSRDGVTMVEIDAVIGPDEGPREVTGTVFELRVPLGPDIQRLGAPSVIVSRSTARWEEVYSGSAEVRLTGTPLDPIHEIPIVSYGAAKLMIGKTSPDETREVEITERPDDYLAYLWPRFYDDPLLDRLPPMYSS